MEKITNQKDLEFRGWQRLHSLLFKHETYGLVYTNHLAEWCLDSKLYDRTVVLKATSLSKACLEAEKYKPKEKKIKKTRTRKVKKEPEIKPSKKKRSKKVKVS